jgi:hypothetical protein
MSRRRLALAGGVSVLVLAALAGALLIARDDPDPISVEIGDAELTALAEAECPPRYEVLRAGTHSRVEIAAAKAGLFVINGERVQLEPQIDWTFNPQDARAFKHQLFKLQWIDPLLFAYRERGDVEALERALAIVLDFAAANPPEGEPVDPDVWDDKRTGDRGPYIAYLLRAASCEGLLGEDESELLLQLMARHISVLTDPGTYKGTNHSLFVDIGLTLLAGQLDFLPEASQWGDLGRERFAETLAANTVADEGLWLEHSSGYQILVTQALTRFLQVPGNVSPELVALRRRMQDVVGWLREPDGGIPQFGDSDLKPVPAFAEARARNDRGLLELDDSGLAVVKEPGSYLAVLASYFSDKHKHADALTFDLFDRGRRLITDTGLYHKDKDENFAYAHATRAHSVLTVDGEEFPRDGSGTYGSGIEQTGKGNGFYAVTGTNPGVEQLGVSHDRLFLYEPGRLLVVADRTEADEEHRYARFLQFAPGVDVRPARDGLELSAPGFEGAVHTNAAGGERIELARGERDPLRGLTSPGFRRWVPRWTARLRSKGSDLTAVTAITLAGPPVSAEVVEWSADRIRIDLRPERGEARGLRIVTAGGDYRIERVPPAPATDAPVQP